MRKLRVLVLMDEAFVPPETIEGLSEKEVAKFKTEYDVMRALAELNHDVKPLGVSGDLVPIRETVRRWKPHIVFNLLEEFSGDGMYVPFLLGYLELIGQPYTGCNPRGMILATNRIVTKKVLRYHRIHTPEFAFFPRNKKTKRSPRLHFPLIVKSATEHGSVGIAQASIVHDDEKLMDRVAFIHEQTQSDALAEEFIEGRELYIGVMGNRRLQSFPIWEMLFPNLPEGAPRIATERVKWNKEYQEKIGLVTQEAKELPKGAEEYIAKLCKRAYRSLGQTGYARIDLRLTEDGRVYFLESNPNPNISHGEDFAASAHAAGVPYDRLLQNILQLGLRPSVGAI